MTMSASDLMEMAKFTKSLQLKGGAGSGNFNHAGRPGKHGGSSSSSVGNNEASSAEKDPSSGNANTAKSIGESHAKSVAPGFKPDRFSLRRNQTRFYYPRKYIERF